MPPKIGRENSDMPNQSGSNVPPKRRHSTMSSIHMTTEMITTTQITTKTKIKETRVNNSSDESEDMGTQNAKFAYEQRFFYDKEQHNQKQNDANDNDDDNVCVHIVYPIFKQAFELILTKNNK